MTRFIPLVLLALIAGCAEHRMYDTAKFRTQKQDYTRIALHEDGLTQEQIEVISSTRPPQEFPVDVSVILLKNGYIDTRLEDMFAYDLVQQLKDSDRIDRVTLVPDYLLPEKISFEAIQELGVRSLSDYVLVFYLDASEFFRWTAIATSKWEVNSSISFILVASGTSAMLTADRLHSTQRYRTNLFKVGEQEKAQKTIFSEQAGLLGRKLDELFGSR